MNLVPWEGCFSTGRVLNALVEMPCVFTRARVRNGTVGPPYMGDDAALGSSPFSLLCVIRCEEIQMWTCENAGEWRCMERRPQDPGL